MNPPRRIVVSIDGQNLQVIRQDACLRIDGLDADNGNTLGRCEYIMAPTARTKSGSLPDMAACG